MPDSQNRDLLFRMPKESPSLKRGTNHLLVIGINAYARLQQLQNAVRDAKAFRDVLIERYRFQAEHVHELYDAQATRRNIMAKLRGLVNQLKAEDSLIIYFSGHGHYDPVFGEGYWVPVGATFEVIDDYIPYTFLQQVARAIPARHLLMIADSCYSGAVLVREKDTVKERFERDPSRWLIASGRNEVVPDNSLIDQHHSPFASELLDLLENYSEEGLTTQMLIARLTENVSYNSRQTPIGQALQNVGHKGGQFVFYPRKNEARDWAMAREMNTVAGYQQFLQRYPDSQRADEAAWQIACLKNTRTAYRQYIDRGGPQLQEAICRLGSLEETEKFERAKRRGESALLKFLVDYPQSTFREQAQAEIARIRAQEREPDAWREAQNVGTQEALQKYLDTFPDGLHVGEARQLIERLKAEQEAAEKRAAEQKRQEAETARREQEQREAAARARELREQQERERQQAQEEARRRKEAQGQAMASLWQRPAVRYGLIGLPMLLLLIWGVPKLLKPSSPKADPKAFTRLMQQADSTFKAGRAARDLSTVEEAGKLYQQASKLMDAPKAERRSQLVNTWIRAYRDSLSQLASAPDIQPDGAGTSNNERESRVDPVQRLKEQGYRLASDWHQGVAIYEKGSGRSKLMGLVNRDAQFLGSTYEKVEELANGYAVFHKGGKRGYLNLQGKEAIPARFDAAWPFNRSGQAKVKLGARTFIINTRGACVRGCEAQAATESSSSPTDQIPVPKMKRIPGGTFLMGSEDGSDSEKPVHKVSISSFEMGVYEVTNEEFCAFLNAKGNQTEEGAAWYNPDGRYQNVKARIQQRGTQWEVDAGYERHPVIYVSWYGARAYANWLNQVSGSSGWRLPTEAEWEYAAGGGSQGRKSDGSRQHVYAGSDELGRVGWYSGNSGGRTHAVGQKAPNAAGLYDLSGNVWEWCQDKWHPNYEGAPSNGRAWESGSSPDRVRRGGSWDYDASYSRVAVRFNSPFNRLGDLGFRLARN